MDQISQLDYLIILTDDSRQFQWLHYASYNCLLVVRSVLAGEMYAFVDSFNMSYVL